MFIPQLIMANLLQKFRKWKIDKKIKTVILLAILILAGFWLAEEVLAAYYTSGTLTSTNLLDGQTVASIESFDYTLSSLPASTTAEIQFSQNGSTWYDSSGNSGQWDTMSSGAHNISLSTLGWLGPNFYYKISLTSDGVDTPVLDDIAVNFTLAGYEMGSDSYLIWSSSINAGGHSQTSTSYRMRDTIGEFVAGTATSTSYKLKMGYQPMLEGVISLTSPSDVVLNPDIGGVSGGTADGSATWKVTTDNPAGYTLSIQASTTPALATSSYSFADYTPAAAGTPDYTWLILAADSEFGFTPEGTDIAQKFKNNDSNACATGTSDTADKCWYNFAASDENIALRYFSNHPSGTDTAVKFRAESGASHIQENGVYQATIIVTAAAN